MDRVGLKSFSIIWLAVVTPLFGVLPVLIMLSEPDSMMSRYGVAILRDLRRLMLADPAPGASHVALSDLAPGPAWLVIVVLVFSVAILFIRKWYVWYSRGKKVKYL